MHRTLVRSSFLAFLSIAVLFAVAQAQPPQKSKSTKSGAGMSYGNAESITEEEMKVYDYFLASDQLEGRNLPSRGYDTAALYVASHLAEWKLKPGGSTSGTNGPLQPYLMPWELVTRQIVTEGTKATMTVPASVVGGGRGGGGRGGAPAGPQTATFELGRDWNVTTAGAGFRSTNPMETLDLSASMVFAGNGYVINKTNINPYEGLDVHGKIVVVAGLPPELAALQAQLAAGGGRGGRGGPIQNPLGVNCVDYLTPDEAAAKNGAVGVVTIANYQQLSTMLNANIALAAGRGPAPGINGPAYQVVKFAAPLPCPSVPTITAGMPMTNFIFLGEKVAAPAVFYGAGANTKMDSFALNPDKKLNLHIVGKNEQGHGENVVGILEGSDPVLKSEFVIISAHLDHIGLSAPQPDGHTVNNGADDDGSGSTGLLGIARAYAEGAAKGMRPKRTIIFLWNGGEERGLWGSRYFAQFPPVDITKVVANLNMDMIGRTKNPNSVDNDPTHRIVDPGGIMIVGPRVSSDDMQKTIEAVNNSYQKLHLDDFYDTTAPDATHDSAGPQPNGQRIFYRSDHYNFAKVGVPIAFFTTGLHVDYHRPTDTPEKIDYHEIQVVSKTVAAVGWVLANQAGRPQLKADLPPLLVQDMKDAKEQGWGKLTPVMPPLPGMPY